jgi:hypothetical protein
MPNNKLTDVEKLAIVQEIENRHIGINAAVRKFGFNKSTLVKWRNRYRYGVEGLAIPTCLANGQDYNQTAVQFRVSYQRYKPLGRQSHSAYSFCERSQGFQGQVTTNG